MFRLQDPPQYLDAKLTLVSVTATVNGTPCNGTQVLLYKYNLCKELFCSFFVNICSHGRFCYLSSRAQVDPRAICIFWLLALAKTVTRFVIGQL